MKRPWPVIIASSILALLALLCSTYLLFAALYADEFFLAAVIVALGFISLLVGFSLWNLRAWAWYSTVFLLSMSALADVLWTVFKNPLPAAPRGFLTLVLLGSLLQPKLKAIFKI